jgi:glycosyltransferase involved in cell wall biosynthesis
MDTKAITILQLLPRLDTGGAERVVIEIAEAVQQSGHNTIIVAENGPLAQAAWRAGAEIIALPMASKNLFTMRSNARKLQKLIQERDVKLIHAHSRAPAWSGFWAAQATAVPFLTTYHGSYSEKNAFKKRYNQVMVKGARVIAVSDYIGGLLRSRYQVPDEKLRIIPGGVDAQKFDPALVAGDRATRLAKEWRLDMGEPVIFLPGRLTSWKGQKTAITALAQLRHKGAQLVLAGGDQGRKTYAQSLIGYAESLGVSSRLRLAGHCEDMPAALMLADIVLNASTEPEAFGRTIIEAQAMGRIVIATDHGGARETIIHGQTGILVPPGDAATLAGRIDQILDLSPDDRIRRGLYARHIVSAKFSVASMQDAVLGVYSELL